MKFSFPFLHSLPAAVLTLLVFSGSGQARIWTDSRKPDRTFEGDLVEISPLFAVIKLINSKNVSLPILSLSAADQKFLKSPEAEAQLKALAEKVAKEKAAEEAAKEAAKAKKLDVKPLPLPEEKK